MSAASSGDGWRMRFPSDYRWSAAVSALLSGARWGASNPSEIDRLCGRLEPRLGDDTVWFEEWTGMADEVRRRARAEERAGHALTAAAHYKRACAYYQMGERFRTPKDRRALGAYRKSLDCFRRAGALIDRPRLERVDVPMLDGQKLPGYLVHAENTRKARPPVVVFFDGLDVSKELQYLWGVEEIVRRGMSVLVMDGPGTGESIRFRKIYLRHDYEVAGTAALDYLESRQDVNGKRAAIMAISLGGYYAPRIASLERRYKACVAWGAIWDYHAIWERRIEASFKTALSVPGHHISWILNVDSASAALAKLQEFRLDGVVQEMRCPFLVTHGENDQQIPIGHAQALYKAVGAKDKTFKVFTEAEGGAQHCQIDNLPIGMSYIADWLAEKLRA
ncbi:MAG: alpha/beta hydrolase [Dehalococcoidia bacterium]